MSNVQNYNPGQLPDIFRDMFAQQGGTNEDLTMGVGMGFPYLSLKGKVFHVSMGDDVELQMTPGTNMPAQYLDVVLVKAARNMSKVFYLHGYTEGSEDKPDCFSNDGVVPDPSSPAKQSTACATCPHNQWGSRASADFESKGKACQDARRTALVIHDPNDIEALNDPMLVRIPPTTLKPMAEYGNMLSKRGVPYQAVLTRIFFDHTVAYPKLNFQAVRYLTNDEAVIIKELMEDELIEQIIGSRPMSAPAPAPQQQPPLQGQPPEAFAQPTTPPPKPQAPPQQQQPPQAMQQATQAMAQFDQQVGGGGMFDQQPPPQAAPAPAPAPAATPKPRRRRSSTAAETPPAQATQPNNVVTMAQQQPPQQTAAATSPLPNGAAHEGVTVIGGDVASGLDSMLSGLPDVPNI